MGLLATLAAAAGCDAIAKLGDEAKQQVQQTVVHTIDDVKQTVGTAGSVELDVGGPVATRGCYANWLRFSGRPTVLQVASYVDPTNESFPSFFLRGQTDSAEPSALIGAALDVEAYLQREADGPIWHTTAEQPAQIVIRSASAEGFAADLQGVLVNSATGESQNVTGKLSGKLQ